MRNIRYREPSVLLKKMAEPDFEKNNRSSVGMEEFVGEFYQINIEKLVPYSKQARVIFNEEELIQLSETIKSHGVRQPLTVIKSIDNEGFFEVISGERRLRAAKIAGLEKVPCIILDNVSHAEEIALIENIQRQDLHPVELSRSLKEILDRKGWGGQTQLQTQLGLSQPQISELLKITNLSKKIQNLLLEKNYCGRDNLRKIFNFKSDSERELYILNSIKGLKLKTKSKEKKMTSMSILRLFFKDDDLRIQKEGLKKLSPAQKELIKEKLKELLSDLS